MKAKSIATGGVFAALYAAVSYIFAADVRQFQTIIIILKILIVAYYAYDVGSREKIVFGLGAVLLSMMLVPVSIAIVYNIPSVFLGITLSNVIKWNKKIVGWLLYVLLNMFFLLYEFVVCYLFSGLNILSSYMSASVKVQILLILYMLLNNMFSASFTYFVVYKFMYKMKRLNRPVQNDKL